MNYFKQNNKNDLAIFHFNEMKYSIGDFSYLHNATAINVTVEEGSMKKRISNNVENQEEIAKNKALLFVKTYPLIYVLGNIKTLSSTHLEEIKNIHAKIIRREEIPGILKIGTGKELKGSIENSKLNSKQIDYLASLAGKVGKRGAVEKEILDGKISQENYSNAVLEYGYDPAKNSLSLLSEQLAELIEFNEEHFDSLEQAEINIREDIELGIINKINYNEITEEYKTKININNLGYQR
ncbi:hypothetical protein LPB90_18465 [Chryseobacterium sp. LC2016-29]|uniref:hypothetical protein n=1 Tax=Chryseobacterium sp. LC2016-29 TaxID=2897331 RepID=UPI001E62782E|nr:hypothetical protein [Chryseobacterium sp. LC2016-29]MCD0480427.1 hypothetical protein [Chryseobacterium sp. LC2016-29]